MPKKKDFLYVVPKGSPHMHRIGQSVVSKSRDQVGLSIVAVKGKKLYCGKFEFQGPSLDAELWDFVPQGAVFEASITFRDVSMAELGGVFLSLGVGERYSVRIGSGKAFGLGKVEVSANELYSSPSGLMQRLSGEEDGPMRDLPAFIQKCKRSFAESWMVHPKGLETIKEICV